MLLRRGADPDACISVRKVTTSIIKSGWTLLHFAVLRADEEIVRILLSAGANQLLENQVSHQYIFS